MSLNSTTKLPGYHLTVGGGFLAFGLAIKKLFPAFGLLPLIQDPCAFFSAVLLPLGTFLAFRALVIQGENRRKLLGQYLLGLSVLPIILACYFYSYVVIEWAINLPSTIPSILPKLVENARTFPKEEQREKQARYAYRIYGVIIAYPLDNLQVVYYVPSEDDKIAWHDLEKTERTTHRMKTSVDAMLAQFPYLFGLYVSTYFCTFLIGGIWLLLKIPAKESDVES